jgi:hypothetical protein
MLLVKVSVDTSRVGQIAWFGIYGEVETMVSWSSEMEGIEPPPILKTISKFVFESELLEVIRLDVTHALHRYNSNKKEDWEEIFTFTVNSQSVVTQKKISSSYLFCHVLKTFELILLNSEECLVAPVAYILISESRRVDIMYNILSEWRAQVRCGRDIKELGSLVTIRMRDQPEPEGDSVLALFTVEVLLNLVKPETVELILVALLIEFKVMISSQWFGRRSKCVLGIAAILSDSCLPWPHPILASPPHEIARELPYAPTPVIAALRPVKNELPETTALTIDVDTDSVLKTTADLQLAVEEFRLIAADCESTSTVSEETVDWTYKFLEGRLSRSEVLDRLVFVQTLRDTIQVVVDKLRSALPVEGLCFREEQKMIETVFPQSALLQAIFKSQAFHLDSRM